MFPQVIGIWYPFTAWAPPEMSHTAEGLAATREAVGSACIWHTISLYFDTVSAKAWAQLTLRQKNLKTWNSSVRFLSYSLLCIIMAQGPKLLGRGSGLDRRSLMMLTTASPSLAPVLATPALFPIALLESSSVNKSARRNTNCILISQINKFYSFHAQGNYPLESFLLKITLYLNRVIKVIRRVFIHLLSMFKLWFHFTIRWVDLKVKLWTPSKEQEFDFN